MKIQKVKIVSIIILGIVIALFCSCNDNITLKEARENKAQDSNSRIVIDSCEYILIDEGIFDQRVLSLTHKGNCKHCRDYFNKQFESSRK